MDNTKGNKVIQPEQLTEQERRIYALEDSRPEMQGGTEDFVEIINEAIKEILEKEKEQKAKKDKAKEIVSYPYPRAYSQEYLKTEKESAELLPIYKEGIIDSLIKNKGLKGTEEERKKIESKLIAADANILSALSRSISGVTLDKVLRFIPEALYRENKRLNTLADGRAIRALPAGDTQLSLFLDAEEKGLEHLRGKNSKTAVITYNSREWAKHIFATSTPSSKQTKSLQDIIDRLCSTKIIHPLGGGNYALLPIVEKVQVELINPTKGLYTEYLRLHPLFTMAITEGRKGSISCEYILGTPSIKINGILSKKLEYRLFNYLELQHSYAQGAIKAAAATDKLVEHREKVEKLLPIISGESATTRKDNKGGTHLYRLKEDIKKAFAKMVEIGIIEPKTFKEEKGCYIWRWSANYLKNTQE